MRWLAYCNLVVSMNLYKQTKYTSLELLEYSQRWIFKGIIPIFFSLIWIMSKIIIYNSGPFRPSSPFGQYEYNILSQF